MFDMQSIIAALKGVGGGGEQMGPPSDLANDFMGPPASAAGPAPAAAAMDPMKKMMLQQALMKGAGQMTGAGAAAPAPMARSAPPPMTTTAPGQTTQSAGGQNDFLQAMLRKYLQGQG